jgi:D-arabinose 1-dehydrogenase-like Zn-dependent alcohol dehydrogenase
LALNIVTHAAAMGAHVVAFTRTASKVEEIKALAAYST